MDRHSNQHACVNDIMQISSISTDHSSPDESSRKEDAPSQAEFQEQLSGIVTINVTGVSLGDFNLTDEQIY